MKTEKDLDKIRAKYVFDQRISVFDFGQMTRKINMCAQLRQLANILNPLTQKINDTILLADSDAYTSALTIYRYATKAKNLNIHTAEWIHAHLDELFTAIRR